MPFYSYESITVYSDNKDKYCVQNLPSKKRLETPPPTKKTFLGLEKGGLALIAKGGKVCLQVLLFVPLLLYKTISGLSQPIQGAFAGLKRQIHRFRQALSEGCRWLEERLIWAPARRVKLWIKVPRFRMPTFKFRGFNLGISARIEKIESGIHRKLKAMKTWVDQQCHRLFIAPINRFITMIDTAIEAFLDRFYRAPIQKLKRGVERIQAALSWLEGQIYRIPRIRLSFKVRKPTIRVPKLRWERFNKIVDKISKPFLRLIKAYQKFRSEFSLPVAVIRGELALRAYAEKVIDKVVNFLISFYQTLVMVIKPEWDFIYSKVLSPLGRGVRFIFRYVHARVSRLIQPVIKGVNFLRMIKKPEIQIKIPFLPYLQKKCNQVRDNVSLLMEYWKEQVRIMMEPFQ